LQAFSADLQNEFGSGRLSAINPGGKLPAGRLTFGHHFKRNIVQAKTQASLQATGGIAELGGGKVSP
jgi:hypothetical protein